VVPKPQNLLVQLHLLVDSPPAQPCLSISNLLRKAYETDLVPGWILEAIRTKSELQEIAIVECIEQEERVWYGCSLYVLDENELRLRILQEHHHTALAGHRGGAKTFNVLDSEYYWNDMRKDVDRYVRNCHECQWSRGSPHSTFRVIRPLHVRDKPREDISMDFVVGLPECEGFDAIWVVVGQHSEMRHCIPCLTIIDALGLVQLSLREVVCSHGLPLTSISDRGPQFASTFWLQVCSRMGIYRMMLTASHPQTDGQADRMNDCMEQYIWVFINH